MPRHQHSGPLHLRLRTFQLFVQSRQTNVRPNSDSFFSQSSKFSFEIEVISDTIHQKMAEQHLDTIEIVPLSRNCTGVYSVNFFYSQDKTKAPLEQTFVDPPEEKIDLVLQSLPEIPLARRLGPSEMREMVLSLAGRLCGGAENLDLIKASVKARARFPEYRRCDSFEVIDKRQTLNENLNLESYSPERISLVTVFLVRSNTRPSFLVPVVAFHDHPDRLGEKIQEEIYSYFEQELGAPVESFVRPFLARARERSGRYLRERRRMMGLIGGAWITSYVGVNWWVASEIKDQNLRFKFEEKRALRQAGFVASFPSFMDELDNHLEVASIIRKGGGNPLEKINWNHVHALKFYLRQSARGLLEERSEVLRSLHLLKGFVHLLYSCERREWGGSCFCEANSTELVDAVRRWDRLDVTLQKECDEVASSIRSQYLKDFSWISRVMHGHG